MSITIKEMKSKRDLKRFIKFPFSLYKDNDFWVPPLFMDEINTLTPGKNAALEFCDAAYWMAFKDGKPAGRIAGIINNRFIEQWGSKQARFGWFDVIDDIDVTKALLETVEQWAVRKGIDALHGPLGFTDMDKEGILVEGFNELGTFATIYNHPYYARHLEELGYVKDTDWVEYEITVPQEPVEKLERLTDIVLKKNRLTIYKPKNKKELVKRYGHELFTLINDAYGHLYGFVTLTEKQINQYIDQYLGFLRLDYICVVIDEEEKVAGVGITMPSLSKAMQRCRGRLFPRGVFDILRAIKKVDLVDLYLVAVRHELQGKGVNAVLINTFLHNFIRLGITKAESNPELEENANVQGQWRFFPHRQHKRRRCYIKHLRHYGDPVKGE